MIGGRRVLFKTFGALLALASSLACATGLPRPVLQALKAAAISPSSVAAVVQEVGASRPSLWVHANEPMNPASVMKLVTTYSALELLGPAFRWKTEVYLDGNDIVLRGYGDPKLNYESFWMLLRNLRGRGLRDIRGDVILDRSYFGRVADEPIDNDSFRPYNVAPDALLVNFKSLRFSFIPSGAAVRVYVEPALPGLEVVNSLKLVGGGCPEGRAFRDLVEASFHSRPPRASFTGAYPVICGERDINVALYAPEDYVAAMIRQLWAEMGGTWSGAVREGTASLEAKLLYRHESEPLAEIVRDINKFSNNVMARQLYLTLAAETGGAPARPENALRAIRQLFAARGIKAPELVMENGSGLSRVERASAATIAALLQAAWRGASMPEFVASLPVVAVDGTMRKRLLDEPVAGHAHVKTGLLQQARSIAGYVLDRHGHRHVVVMLVNDPRAPESQAALDALLAWVHQGPTAPAATTGGPRGGGPRHP